MWWKEVQIDNWGEFNTFIDKHLNTRDWIFRGQNDTNWDLKTSLYREFEKAPDILEKSNYWFNKLGTHRTIQIEEELIDEFRSSYHLYSSIRVERPLYDDFNYDDNFFREKLELLSLMQHHGAPTRLLDWTISPYIATFFALDGAENDFCIYALNTSLLENFDKERFERYSSKKYSIFDNFPQSFIYKYNPAIKNERLRKQQGLFLVPSVNDKTIDEIMLEYGIINGYLENEIVAYKLIFKKEMIQYYWTKLKQMNITHEMLYPGIDGFCKSLKLNLLDLLQNTYN